MSESWIPDSSTARKVWRSEFHKWILWGAPLSAAVFAWQWATSSNSTVVSRSGLSPVFWGSACAVSSLLSLFALYAYVHRKRMRYSRDSFFAINWTWSYTLDGRIKNLRAWCPVCRAGEIVFKEGVVGMLLTSDNFLCRICGYDSYRSPEREKIPFKPHPEVIRRIEAKRTEMKYKRA